MIPAAPPTDLPPAPRGGLGLGPAGAVALAAAAAGGALVARPLSLLLPAALLVAVVAARRPLLLAVPVALAASALGARAVDGLTPPPAGPVTGTATLVSDPEARWGTVEAVARLGGRHVLLVAEGTGGEILAPRLAGERVVVAGRLRALPDRAAGLRVRHVVAEVRARTVLPGPEAAPPWRVANHLRRLLVAGAEPLGSERRALYLGLVLGDDRQQPPEQVDDFRGSGLAHLLAVSGQNVAFVLALAAPVLGRLRSGARLGAVVALLGLVAVVTRCEPSVLRAVAMAGGAAVAAARGRPTPGVQLLALAVTALVLLDPLLVRSLGFQLSVAATAGILVVGPRLAAVVPGPPPVRAAVAVSAAAQLGVAPLLVAGFGGVPVASLPANLVAAPLAAVVLTWGLPAGLVAGLAGAPLDGWLHRPTGLALSALGAVARAGASAPLGELGPGAVAAATAGVAVLVALDRRAAMAGPGPAAVGPGSRFVAAVAGVGPARVAGPPSGPALGEEARDRARTGGFRLRVARVGAVGLVVGALLVPGVALRWQRPLVARPSPGLAVWRAGGATVVVVEPGSGPTATLRGLRQTGVTAIDLLVVGPGPAAVAEARAARHRAPTTRAWHLGRDPPEAMPPLRLGGLEVVRQGEAGVCVRARDGPPCRAAEPAAGPRGEG